MSAVQLGLIGGNIAASKSPALHRIAGQLCGLDVSYHLLTPAQLGQSFDEVFERCARSGFRGVNVTYPFKETARAHVVIDDSLQAAVGSCNTVLFGTPVHRGGNTDFSGFAKAYRSTFGAASPGRVAIAGAGGVGKAVTFALGMLGAQLLAIFDTDLAKAKDLKQALTASFPALPVSISSTVAEAIEGAEGLVNCTPVGMGTQGGSAFPVDRLRAQSWAFDAVYTPIDTPFMQAARQAGLATMTGYELFLFQGIDAFRIFTGIEVDSGKLRQALRQSPDQAGVPA